MKSGSPYRILMVCTGNICRSPSAEGVLRHMVAAEGLDGRVEIDGAGLADWHVGSPPNPRAVRAAAARGYDLSGLAARKFDRTDFFDFNLILAMDNGHFADLAKSRPQNARATVAMFLEAASEAGRLDVPDPYYGDETDYEYSLDLIEAGCKGWIRRLQSKA